jgi:[ribosomal protein S5]-alanine N-acetyltransferase
MPTSGGPVVSTQTNVSGCIGRDRGKLNATWAQQEPEQSASQYCGTKSSPAVVVNIDGSCPTLRTRRFQFRPFEMADIGRMAMLAGEHHIADTSIGIPHPYTLEFARMWISSHPTASDGRPALHWAAIEVGEDRIVGYAGLDKIDTARCQAELRLWVGCGVKRKSDAIEWSAAIVDFALTDLTMNRIYALQFDRHLLAGRVLAAIGMQREGLVRKRIYEGGQFEDVFCWAIARRQEAHSARR